jgi:purine-cytosine permease-like protein
VNSLLVEALNGVIDLHARRIAAALHNRVPVTVWVALYTVVLIALTLIGYQSGMTGTKRVLVPSLLILAFSVVILLIADLDRPQQGMLKVSQQAMLNLQRQLQSEVGPPSGPRADR